eukprot:TRINITY_DN8657_c0_g1_i3.p1 TRINITY_DN8657_c0_g1~~TRINITY_DN8657_c0_g1_i3.p1  ORF type:complete len:665 (+),score=135.81 TRINITY_DN8657_c0_g1_i3:800-2794(+)
MTPCPMAIPNVVSPLHLGFYFQVSNTRKGHKVRFHIMNLAKKDLMYSKGMKIALFSKASATKKWFRGGEDIQYTQNKHTSSRKPLYMLSFTYEFLHDDDTVSMAFSEPYTFTEIMQDIKKFQRKMSRRHVAIREPLCTTVGGCLCEMLTVTSNCIGNKRTVVFTARVHPGETVGSWMMKGILAFLSSGSALAESLLEKYVFKIVPCITPDGVVQGNYRCSLSGFDLNRKYTMPSRILHPTIYYIKQMVRSINNPILFYCDLHGHSKKKDVFAYGNIGENPLGYRLFPYILSKINRYFSYKASRFSVSKSKASTARIAMWKELRIPAVYTIEASFFGPSAEPRHFTPDDLIQMGHSICQALMFYSQFKEMNEQKGDSVFARQIVAELKADPETFASDKDDSGSDSNSSENEADVKEVIDSISSHSKLKDRVEEAEIDGILSKLIGDKSDSFMNEFEPYSKERKKGFTLAKVLTVDRSTEQGKVCRDELVVPKKAPDLEMWKDPHSNPQELAAKWTPLENTFVSKYPPDIVDNEFIFSNPKANSFNIKNTQVMHTKSRDASFDARKQSAHQSKALKEIPKLNHSSHYKAQNSTIYKQHLNYTDKPKLTPSSKKDFTLQYIEPRPHRAADASRNSKPTARTCNDDAKRAVSAPCSVEEGFGGEVEGS